MFPANYILKKPKWQHNSLSHQLLGAGDKKEAERDKGWDMGEGSFILSFPGE